MRPTQLPPKHRLEVGRAQLPPQRDPSGAQLVVTDIDGARAAILAAAAGLVITVQVPDGDPDLVELLRLDLGRLGGVDVVEHGDDVVGSQTFDRQTRELLDLLTSGSSLGAAAALLHMSRRTADRRVAAARRKAGARSTAALLVAYQVDRQNNQPAERVSTDQTLAAADRSVSRIRP